MSPRFVADSMLGRLARWLRAFGYDVYYDPFLDDHGVVACARERRAIALTRDTRFPRPPDVSIIFVDSDHVSAQLAQVVAEAPLGLAEARPLTRCTVCNGGLVPARRDEVWDRIPPYVYLTHETYAHCPDCGRVYWEGTHAPRIRRELARLSQSARDGRPRE
ncbi:MAG: Mut7-C RNAse domain-containing protein [Armatimonadetes bacterium]|nr:Mut7-C RNAse domain-containing protein [Armatimonadota bacterium]